MLIRIVTAAFLALFISGLFAVQGANAQQLTYPEDKGPAKINVSKYPADKQKAYKLFQERCTKCHNAGRSLFANKFGKATWEPVMKKMATRPGSDVTPEEEKVLLDFVVFDHDKRKTDITKFWSTLPKKK